MSHVFVVDPTRTPLNPVHPGRARLLLKAGKAMVYRRYPFTLILKAEVKHPEVTPLRVKLDPGSKTTGIAVVNDASGDVVSAFEVSHRGHAIKAALNDRQTVRRSRRQRKTRYRKPRFDNRHRRKGWLPPSLESRIANILTWVARLSRYCSIQTISMELVKFDLQQMDNPEISGLQYQQGTLAGYEVREYLLEKWNRQCAYCGKEDIPLQVEHIHPRANGGTNRVSNHTLACEPCNIAKGTRDISDFLKKKPDMLKKVLAQAKAPLKDAAAVNVTRWALYEQLKALGLPVECGTGGLTKYNRTMRALPKAHWIDAACVGRSTPAVLACQQVIPLLIKATGHGNRRMCVPDKYGFPRTSAKGARQVKGFQTGDIVKARVSQGKKVGTYVGRVAVRAAGSFNITTQEKTIQGISSRCCQVLQRSDGYRYTKGAALFPPHV